ncbi:MAG TPA: BolA family protein [Pseudobdellovibrionaceae bacterium]|nr:BolA family protein [Pseudobdellovibrionaceae bacterium]
MSGRKERISEILNNQFSPVKLDVIDESHKHAAHGKGHPDSEHDGKEETHFKVVITAEVFKNKSRIERQRIIHEALHSEFKAGLHALTMKIKAPGEA